VNVDNLSIFYVFCCPHKIRFFTDINKYYYIIYVLLSCDSSINDREILEHAGKVKKKIANEIATMEYEKYKQQRQSAAKIESIKNLENEIKSFGNKKS
jgi:hypothetical protein